jgi:hypothetical protein
MSIAAQSIIHRVVDTLQDNTSIRWPVGELARYFNDGQREVILYRPDAMVTNTAQTLVSGSKQAIPATGSKLIEVVKNTISKKAIRLCNREILDAQQPGWHALTGVVDAVHYCYDPRDPKVFYVYPPNTGTGSVDLIYSNTPTDITEPSSGDYTAITGNLSVPDIYANVIQDYILYRAYAKDADYAANGARSQAAYASFAAALGIEIKATIAIGPTSKGNPNVTAPAA